MTLAFPPTLRPLALLTALVLAAGCDSVKLDTFTITRTGSADIPGGPGLPVLSSVLSLGGLNDMKFSDSQEFKNQGVKPSDVDSVTLSKLRLDVTKPASGQDLTFFKSVKFYAEGKDPAGAALPRVLLASGGPFTAGQNGVDLTLTHVELKPYLTAPSMSITSDVDGQPPKQDSTVRATISLRVDVDVSGVVTGN